MNSKKFYQRFAKDYNLPINVFDEDMFKFVLKKYTHLERCLIKIPDNFVEIIESKKVSLSHFLKTLKDNNNVLYYNEKNSNPHIANYSGLADTNDYFALDLADISKIIETYCNF